MNETCDGPVLLVGDGDFSFSASLLQHSSLLPHQVTTSNLESESSIQQHSQAQQSLEIVKQLGATVLLGVDARELHTHPSLSQQRFERVIFNFPLADRHNIKKNRALIADFMSSCRSILAEEGKVMVTLCKGQGGTPADHPMRSWHDSWQVVAMAANSGFVLQSVVPFNGSQYPGYHSVGFRFQDKSFNTSGALTHTFVKADSVSSEPLALRGVFAENFSCSRYVADKLKRNLLQEKDNPVSLVFEDLAENLFQHLKADLMDMADVHIIACGHKALVRLQCVVPDQSECRAGDGPASAKERKNTENLEMSRKELSHSSSPLSESNISGTTEHQNGQSLLWFLPSEPEAVYVLVPKARGVACKNSCDESGSENASCSAISACDGGEGSRGLNDLDGGGTELESNGRPSETMEYSEAMTITDSLYTELKHLQVSMLECLPNILPRVISSAVLKAQCAMPCPIHPSHLPVRHELLLVQRQEEMSAESFHNTLDRVISVLSDCPVMTGCTLASDRVDNSWKLTVQGVDSVTQLHSLSLTTSDRPTVGCGFVCRVFWNGQSFLVCVLSLDTLSCQAWSIPDPRLLWSTHPGFIKQFSCAEKFQFKFTPLSLYPMKFVHDLSFWTPDGDFDEEELQEVIRCLADDNVVNVSLMDTYFDSGTNRHSRCYRLHLISYGKALAYCSSWKLQSFIRLEVAHRLNVELR